MTDSAGGWGRLAPRLGRPFSGNNSPRTDGPPSLLPVLFVVEGPHDVEFLCRISRILHGSDARLPDLGRLEEERELVFLPLGSNGPGPASRRLALLGRAEFHLYDSEGPDQRPSRRRALAGLRLGARCRAVLTGKRALENYLHPDAVAEEFGERVEFGDDDVVADCVARRLLAAQGTGVRWEACTPRTRRRLQQRAKRRLNTAAVERMTVPRLAYSDPGGEIASWLTSVGELIRDSR